MNSKPENTVAFLIVSAQLNPPTFLCAVGSSAAGRFRLTRVAAQARWSASTASAGPRRGRLPAEVRYICWHLHLWWICRPAAGRGGVLAVQLRRSLCSVRCNPGQGECWEGIPTMPSLDTMPETACIIWWLTAPAQHAPLLASNNREWMVTSTQRRIDLFPCKTLYWLRGNGPYLQRHFSVSIRSARPAWARLAQAVAETAPHRAARCRAAPRLFQLGRTTGLHHESEALAWVG